MRAMNIDYNEVARAASAELDKQVDHVIHGLTLKVGESKMRDIFGEHSQGAVYLGDFMHPETDDREPYACFQGLPSKVQNERLQAECKVALF